MTIIYHGSNQLVDFLKLPQSEEDSSHEYYGNAIYFSDNGLGLYVVGNFTHKNSIELLMFK